MAYKFVTVFGMDKSVGTVHCDWKDKKISEDLKQRIDSNVRKLIDEAYIRAKDFIVKNLLF